MCEESYSGCPYCDAAVEEVVYQTTGYMSVEYPVDSAGEPYFGDGPCWQDDALEPSDSGHLYCNNCGASGFELRDGIIPEGCECEECCPGEQQLEDAGGADDIVLLARAISVSPELVSSMTYKLNRENIPAEIDALLKRQSVWRIPVRRERGKVILEWLEHQRPSIRNYFALQDRLAPSWMLPHRIPEQQQIQEEVA